ncbi:hypothetical protein vBCbaSRXM_8 [Citromicrobium phage vB_CbaS-RXM]|nr:hypothetical protein vBCbaSRXM_8 [Citromicrobium phage vB_CbaS-RXM]
MATKPTFTGFPQKFDTNEEFIQHLMNYSDSGALMQGYLMEALRIYSEQVLRMSDTDRARMDEGLIPYAAWERCATEALAKLKVQYGE